MSCCACNVPHSDAVLAKMPRAPTTEKYCIHWPKMDFQFNMEINSITSTCRCTWNHRFLSSIYNRFWINRFWGETQEPMILITTQVTVMQLSINHTSEKHCSLVRDKWTTHKPDGEKVCLQKSWPHSDLHPLGKRSFIHQFLTSGMCLPGSSRTYF